MELPIVKIAKGKAVPPPPKKPSRPPAPSTIPAKPSVLTSKTGSRRTPPKKASAKFQRPLPPAPSTVRAAPAIPLPPPPKAASFVSSSTLGADESKGYGKGNYGIPIPTPLLIEVPENTQAAGDSPPATQPDSPEPHDAVPRALRGLKRPAAIPATPQDVEAWMKAAFVPLCGISSMRPPPVGSDVLWKGVKKGRRGGPSNAVEWFNGKVANTVEKEDGWYAHVS